MNLEMFVDIQFTKIYTYSNINTCIVNFVELQAVLKKTNLFFNNYSRDSEGSGSL